MPSNFNYTSLPNTPISIRTHLEPDQQCFSPSSDIRNAAINDVSRHLLWKDTHIHTKSRCDQQQSSDVQQCPSSFYLTFAHSH
ncbi:hypothetical protein FH972_026538 [Carpinus fangiana]|uniref:Uncharacterized protein n=1 Tax=Carpinus fangiana TaxID=176857 RepID=A0A5N6L4A0_9ROSI|nr:hypothetical protein FH972_026538 [Carpinus fangiana]